MPSSSDIYLLRHKNTGRMLRFISALLLICVLSFSLNAQTTDIITADPLMTALPAADPLALAARFLKVTPEPQLTADSPEVGMLESFVIHNTLNSGLVTVQAQLHARSDHAYIWVQSGFAPDEEGLRALGEAFDAQVYEQVRYLWGEEESPGIDNDSRIHLLFVGGLGSVAAYYTRKNDFPREIFISSNERQIITINLDLFAGALLSDSELRGRLVGTLAHEFQHMIRANQSANSAGWINEGFSTFTQIAVNSIPDADRAISAFLEAPGTQLNSFGLMGSTAPNYGAGALFTLFLFERYGLEGLQTLSASSLQSVEAIERALQTLDPQAEMDLLFAEWVLANWIQDVAAGYGYAGISLAQRPASQQLAADVALERSFETAQYATQYLRLGDLGAASELDLTLSLPEFTTLTSAEATSGDRVWYSNRGDFSHSRLSRSFDLRDVSSATLSYRLWYDLETQWDYVYVSISADGGQSWNLLQTPLMDTLNPNGTAYGPAYTGFSGGWLQESLSLDAYTGQNVLIQFEMVTDDNVNLPGLLLDDISIPEIDYRADLNADMGGWATEGWLWTEGFVPQQAWLQVIQQSGQEVSVERILASGGEAHLRVSLLPDAAVTIAISPFALLSTEAASYSLRLIPVQP